MRTVDFDEVVEHYQRALGEFVKGNPEPNKMVFSHQEDVTLANPLGPAVRGWEQVAATMERAASQLREGEVTGFEIVAKYVTPDLAYMVWVERAKAKLGGRQDIVPIDPTEVEQSQTVQDAAQVCSLVLASFLGIQARFLSCTDERIGLPSSMVPLKGERDSMSELGGVLSLLLCSTS